MAIIFDGKRLAEKIKAELKIEYKKLGRMPMLAFVLIGSDSASEKFIEQKQKFGAELGVNVLLRKYKADISGAALRKNLAELAHDEKIQGIVIQLPLPQHLQTQDILNAVPPQKDVDVLSARAVGNFAVGKSEILPPVVGAVDALFREYHIEYKKRQIVIVGSGRLVGKPLAEWLMRQGIGFCVLTDKSQGLSSYTKEADIIISGVGKAGLINGSMIKEGSIVIDAGVSESEGPSTSLGIKKFVGDVDFDSVSKKAAYLTPVPGGVGPLTVVMIFKNLLDLISKR